MLDVVPPQQLAGSRQHWQSARHSEHGSGQQECGFELEALQGRGGPPPRQQSDILLKQRVPKITATKESARQRREGTQRGQAVHRGMGGGQHVEKGGYVSISCGSSIPHTYRHQCLSRPFTSASHSKEAELTSRAFCRSITRCHTQAPPRTMHTLSVHANTEQNTAQHMCMQVIPLDLPLEAYFERTIHPPTSHTWRAVTPARDL